MTENHSLAEKPINNLILLLAQAQTIQISKDSIKCLSQREIDWKEFCQTADEQRVFPFVYHRLKTEYAQHLSSETLLLLQTRYHQIAQRNLGLTAQLLKLVKLLATNSVPVLAYKGAAFSSLIYQDVALRQFTDLDLLIRKRDFAKVKELLAANDCHPISKLNEKLEKAILKYDYELPFLTDQSKILIEVHWKLAEHFFSFDLDTEELWHRKIETNILGRNVSTLSIEDSLVVHCAHNSKHLWKRLGWILDVAQLITRKTIDWNLAIKLAEECGSLRMVWLGLWLSKKVLNADLPSNIWQRIEADKKVSAIGEKLKNFCFSDDAKASDWKMMARMHLKMRERFKDKMLYSFRLLITTKLVDSFFMPLGRPR